MDFPKVNAEFKQKQTKNIVRNKSQTAALFSGVAIGYAITFIVFIAYALILTYSSVTEKNMNLVVTLTTLISVLVAGFDAAKNAENRGLLWGLGAGLLYALILILIGNVVNNNFIFDGKTISTLLISMAGGGLGGILGINLKNKKN